MVDGQGYVRSSKEEMSQLAAELYAVVCVECQDTSVHLVTVINDLLTDTHSKVCALHVLLEWFFCVCVSCDYPYPSVPLAAYSPSCQWSGKPGNIREFDSCQGIDEKFRNVWGKSCYGKTVYCTLHVWGYNSAGLVLHNDILRIFMIKSL